ncbi:MAG: GDSL-type esterase/lipase family protein [Bacteroidota bacterium]
MTAFAVCSFGFSTHPAFRIFLAGDSTMADKPQIDNPEHGWGQELPLYFSENVDIFNYARNGRSTRSFLYQGIWDAMLEKMQPGDYVFIQFGHNDSKKSDSSRYAAPQTDYRNNLLRMICDAQAKKAIPVLITPVNRRKYDTAGQFVDQHGEYPDVVRDVAKKERVFLIDLHQKSKTLLEDLGAEGSKKYFLTSVKPHVYRSLPNGKDDNTHFTNVGAVSIAGLVVEGIRELHLPLEKELILDSMPALPGNGVVVGLDEYFNNERKKIDDTLSIPHHYTWDDTTDGGFSEFAKMLDWSGADIDTVQTAPTKEALDRFSVYIIVDPDSPKENDSPNYIDRRDGDVIEQWVRNGGTLVLLANDTLNCEFDHLNTLSERFGIHFNGDSKHYFRNTAADYQLGWSAHLPKHPLFDGVRGLFIKQVSSMALKSPAVPLLTEEGSCLMATAQAGKGFVIAVGDPWIYNEYMHAARVPDGYQNYDAAKQFSRWLCDISKKVRE